jgi:hypothetical protein
MFKKILRMMVMVLGGVAMGTLAAFLFGWVVMLLWNWLMPSLFGLPVIGYWKAWGILIMAHLLFKTGHHGMGSHVHPHSNRAWKEKFAEKIENHFKECNASPEKTASE